MDITTNALVLREVSYKEADKILTVLTPDYGKLTVNARGCRRKNSRVAAAAELLVYSEMTLYEYGGRRSIREASTLQLFPGVRRDVVKLSLGSYMAELAEQVAMEDTPEPELCSLILNALYALDTLDKPVELVRAVYELKLMCVSGYEPMLDCCAACGEEPDEPALYLPDGALCCRKCRAAMGSGRSITLTRGSLAAMRHIAGGNPKKLFSFRLEEPDMRNLSGVCEAYLLDRMERSFRTLDFYKSFIRRPQPQEETPED